MMNTVTELGVGGIFAVLVIREVLNFLRIRKNGGYPDRKFSEMYNWVEDLWNWHNVTDNDGVKIWYVRRSLEDAIRKLSDNIDVQTKAFQEMVNEMKATRRDLSLVEQDIRELKG
ncbi:MAG: hypothetical protein COV46_03540 [Deltaproteobacteria bacterium CG11_big_fil_rev_8_21_14_0_20_49_13]|nr:MAG: hypothetical protein COV46_03540 [Deltaproteobacteria bacterium CG11_big_fil_rev_8_21_14_0_20_49_13]